MSDRDRDAFKQSGEILGQILKKTYDNLPEGRYWEKKPRLYFNAEQRDKTFYIDLKTARLVDYDESYWKRPSRAELEKTIQKTWKSLGIDRSTSEPGTDPTRKDSSTQRDHVKDYHGMVTDVLRIRSYLSCPVCFKGVDDDGACACTSGPFFRVRRLIASVILDDGKNAVNVTAFGPTAENLMGLSTDEKQHLIGLSLIEAALLKRYLQDTYTGTVDTPGLTITPCQIEVDGNRLFLQIWDLGNIGNLRDLLGQVMMECGAIMICFDLSRNDTIIGLHL